MLSADRPAFCPMPVPITLRLQRNSPRMWSLLPFTNSCNIEVIPMPFPVTRPAAALITQSRGGLLMLLSLVQKQRRVNPSFCHCQAQKCTAKLWRKRTAPKSLMSLQEIISSLEFLASKSPFTMVRAFWEVGLRGLVGSWTVDSTGQHHPASLASRNNFTDLWLKAMGGTLWNLK